jgi:inhibitor of cysteine peptidase
MAMRSGTALLVVALIIASCGAGDEYRLTESDSQSEFDVAVGDSIVVSLEENPSTGYRWEPAGLPDMLELTTDEYVAPESDQVGVPGARELGFEVVSEDAGILRLEYTRPFDDPPVAERIVEYVIVAGDAVWPPVTAGSSPSTSTGTAP